MNQLTKLLDLCLKRWPRLSNQSNEGVMTATDDLSFIGFQLLYSSIVVRHKCPVAVVDLGMRDEQRAWCERQSSLMLISPDVSALRFNGEEGHQERNKPYLFLYSPFQKTLWLDPETMVLNDLTQLFNMINDGPVIMNTKEEISDSDWFFSKMPGDVAVPPQAHYPNAAVIGLDIQRDFFLIRDWMWVLENVMDGNFKAAAKRSNSAALAWGLAKHDKTGVAIDNPTWNWNTQGGINGLKFVEYSSVEHLLISVQKDFPLAHIINWGWPAPWMGWKDFLIDINPHQIHYRGG